METNKVGEIDEFYKKNKDKMKLLFFSEKLNGGGAERVLVNLTNELVMRGHEVTIALNKESSLYVIDPRIKLLNAPHFKETNRRGLVRRLLRGIARRRCYSRHTHHAINQIRPEIIITFMHCNILPIIRFHGSIPIVHSEHNAYDRDLGFGWYFRRFFLNRLFDSVCVLSPFDQGYALAKGLKKTVVMPNPNSFESISLESYYDCFAHRKNILVCGRVSWWYIKGFDLAIEMFSKIADKFPDVDLDVVGYGDDKSLSYLKQVAIKFNIKERIHFLGQRSDIKEIMCNHKLFVLSSRTEGFPMVITESMTQGLPCVAFERLASSIIVNGIDGVLVKELDIDKMAEWVSLLLIDDEKRYSLGQEAIKNVARFSSENIAAKWEDLFSVLIKK